jgi:pSer/pThr/pTyr-binding forkhead associated (FHA) protein
MGLLHVLDDGEETGEVIRLRGGSFVIGRVEGDLVIPHDGGISGRHAEILRRVEEGAVAWILRDLGSTNGTFVRASTVALHHDQELLIGGRIVRFSEPAPGTTAPEAPAPSAEGTRKWEGLGRPAEGRTSPPPALVVELPGAEPARYPLTGTEFVLGRDPSRCSIVVDEPTVDPRHARVYRYPKGRWIIANERSRNGLWARVREVALGRGGAFQCGEQRFFFKAL